MIRDKGSLSVLFFFYIYLFSWGRDVHTQVLVSHSVHAEVRSEENWWELALSVPLVRLGYSDFTCRACYLPSCSFAFG